MKTVIRALLPVLLFALLAGCSKVTVENYNKLKTGMSYGEVEAILGKPERCSDVLTVRSCRWGDDRRFIQVNFVADTVVLFNSDNIR